MSPEIVDVRTWTQRRRELLAEEKQHTRASDRLAAARRELPMTEVSTDYVFDTVNGKASLTICSPDTASCSSTTSCSTSTPTPDAWST